MANAFEERGLFYRVLERDAARWPSAPPKRFASTAERRPLSYPPRPRSHRLSELPPPAQSTAPRRTSSRPPLLRRERDELVEELQDLRHQVDEARRSTEERKALYLRELNRLRQERDRLAARVVRLERELEGAQQTALATRKLSRGLAATGGLATATGVLSLAVLLKNALQLGRGRLGWFRHA